MDNGINVDIFLEKLYNKKSKAAFRKRSEGEVIFLFSPFSLLKKFLTVDTLKIMVLGSNHELQLVPSYFL